MDLIKKHLKARSVEAQRMLRLRYKKPSYNIRLSIPQLPMRKFTKPKFSKQLQSNYVVTDDDDDDDDDYEAELLTQYNQLRQQIDDAKTQGTPTPPSSPTEQKHQSTPPPPKKTTKQAKKLLPLQSKKPTSITSAPNSPRSKLSKLSSISAPKSPRSSQPVDNNDQPTIVNLNDDDEKTADDDDQQTGGVTNILKQNLNNLGILTADQHVALIDSVYKDIPKDVINTKFEKSKQIGYIVVNKQGNPIYYDTITKAKEGAGGSGEVVLRNFMDGSVFDLTKVIKTKKHAVFPVPRGDFYQQLVSPV